MANGYVLITLRRTVVLCVVGFVAVSGVFAQSPPGTYQDESDNKLRVLVEPALEGYTFSVLRRQGRITFRCEPRRRSVFECSVPQGPTITLIKKETRSVVAFGEDTFRLGRVRSAGSGDVDVYRGAGSSGVITHAIVRTRDAGISLTFTGWEPVVHGSATSAPDGSYRVEGDNQTVTFNFDDDGLVVAPEGAPPQLFRRLEFGIDERYPLMRGRYRPSRTGRTADQAFSNWYGEHPAVLHEDTAGIRAERRGEIRADGRLLGPVSPDGFLYAGYAPGEALLGIYEGARGLLRDDIETSRAGSIGPSILWAPDRSHALATDDTPHGGADSDLFFLRAAGRDNSVEVVTEDDYDGPISNAPDGVYADVAPVWIHPRREAAFLRLGDDMQATLATFRTDTGEIQPVLELPPALSRVHSLSVSPATMELFFGVTVDEGRGAETWVLRRSAASLQRIALPEEYDAGAVLADVSFDGRHLLLLPPGYLGTPDIAANPPFIYDRERRRARSVAPPNSTVLGASFSPDGSKIAYVFRGEGSDGLLLAMRDLRPDAEEHILADDLQDFTQGAAPVLPPRSTPVRRGVSVNLRDPSGFLS